MAYSDFQTPVNSQRNQINIDHDKHYDQSFLSIDFAGNLLGVDSDRFLRNESTPTERSVGKKYPVKKFIKLKDKKLIYIYGSPSQLRHRAFNSEIPDHIPINLKYSPKNSNSLGNCTLLIYIYIYIYIANNNSIKLRRDAPNRQVFPSLRSPHSNNTKISLKHSHNIKTHSEKVGMSIYIYIYIYRYLVI